jgi:hypothetical protein
MEAARREAMDVDKLLTEQLAEFARQAFAATVDVEAGLASPAEHDIERLLERLHAAIDRMDAVGGGSTAARVHVSRFRAIAHEKQVDWNKASSAARQRREHQQLLRSTDKLLNKQDNQAGGESAKLLYERERAGIHNSMRAMEENIGQALGIQDALRAQSERLRGAGSGLLAMSENIPGVNVLIKAAGKKKTRDNMIVATAIATGLCLMFWWVL